MLNFNCEHFTFGLPMIDKLRRFMQEKVGWNEVKTDQILLPVITEMKRRSKSVVQSSIQSFFPQTGSFGKSHVSKRVQEIIKDWN
jgi:DNA excision repair protein ERCC-5